MTSLRMTALSILRRRLWLALPTLLLSCAGPAAATNYSFPGNLPTGCSDSGNGVYNCPALVLGKADVITIDASKPTSLTINGDLTTNSAQINPSGAAANLNLVVLGKLTTGSLAVLNANLTVMSINGSSGGGASFGGNISGTDGVMTFGDDSTVSGQISNTSGAVTLGQRSQVGTIGVTSGAVTLGQGSKVGNVNSTSGTITLAKNSVINGSINSNSGAVSIGDYGKVHGLIATTSGAVNLGQSVTVSGSMATTSGNISMGAGGQIGGSLISQEGSITLARGTVSAACVQSVSNAIIALGPQVQVGSVCCGASSACTQSCVDNQSGYAMPPLCNYGSAPDHYELSLPSSSLSCQPSTVSVTACATSATPCTSAYTGAAGSSVSLATSSAVLGATTLQFNAAGQASTTLSYPGATNASVVSVALSGESLAATGARRCCPDGVSCLLANSCATSFKTAGFVIADSANASSTTTLPSQTAGTTSSTYYLRAVQTNTTTRACEAGLSGPNTVNWAQQCTNPDTCSGSPLMTITGSSATLVNNNSATAVTRYSAVQMVFDSQGNAPFSLSYGDAGQVRLWVSKTLNSATLSGSSNAFVSKPASLALARLRQTASPALANPAAASASDAKFIRAGEAFSADLSALSASGLVTPNFGRESTPEGVLLTPVLVLPVGGTVGTLANASIAGAGFINGVASISNLSYDEVGIITLTPSLVSGNYQGAGAISGSTSANLGRFVPDHFVLTPGTPSPACSARFSYFGQDGLSTPFTLTAQNQAKTTTQNYNGSFAKLGLGIWANFGFTASGLPSGSTLAASATAPNGSWLAGVAGVSARHQFSRPASASAEWAVTVSAAPVDSDGVALSAASIVGAATPLRYGRLRLSNAFGSARAALQVPVNAEYWSGNSWMLNSADSCTTLTAVNVALSNPRDAAGNASSATSSASAVTLASGSGLLTLSAPAPAGSSLSLDLALNLGSNNVDQSCQANHPTSTGAAKPWLRGQNGSCAASTDRDPAARASFGIYSPESRKTVHVREIF